MSDELLKDIIKICDKSEITEESQSLKHRCQNALAYSDDVHFSSQDRDFLKELKSTGLGDAADKTIEFVCGL